MTHPVSLLAGETTIYEGAPHPLSFLSQYTPWVMLMAWAVAFPVLWPAWLPAGRTAAWCIGLFVILGTSAYFAIRTFYMIVAAFLVAGALLAATPFAPSLGSRLAFLALAVGAMGAIGVELQRRSHWYQVTNLRVLTRSGLLTRRTRILRHGTITDVHVSQSVLGRMANFGTVIPITQSGFGLGDDSSFVGAAAGVGQAFGRFPLLIGAGGGRSRSTARATSGNALVGVRPLGAVVQALESEIQRSQVGPLLDSQLAVLQRIDSNLRRARA